MTPEQKLKEAKKRVKRKKDFYEHLTTYVAISVFLVVLNMITSPGHWWFQWPVIGWGMAVLFNYFDVFGVPGVGPMNKEWEQKAIQEELRKMEGGEDEVPDRLELPTLGKRENWDESDLV
jgi:hypothetical protein